MTAAAASALGQSAAIDPESSSLRVVAFDPDSVLQLMPSAPRELIDEAYWVLAARVKRLSGSSNETTHRYPLQGLPDGENYQTNSRAHSQYIDALNIAYERAKRGPAPAASSDVAATSTPRRRRGWRRGWRRYRWLCSGNFEAKNRDRR